MTRKASKWNSFKNYWGSDTCHVGAQVASGVYGIVWFFALLRWDSCSRHFSKSSAKECVYEAIHDKGYLESVWAAHKSIFNFVFSNTLIDVMLAVVPTLILMTIVFFTVYVIIRASCVVFKTFVLGR